MDISGSEVVKVVSVAVFRAVMLCGSGRAELTLLSSYAGFFLGLLFDPEGRGDMFL
jgi:hypothetical protein